MRFLLMAFLLLLTASLTVTFTTSSRALAGQNTLNCTSLEEGDNFAVQATIENDNKLTQVRYFEYLEASPKVPRMIANHPVLRALSKPTGPRVFEINPGARMPEFRWLVLPWAFLEIGTRAAYFDAALESEPARSGEVADIALTCKIQ